MIPVGQRQDVVAEVRPELAADEAGDGTVRATGRGRRERHEPVATRDVVLPSAPRDRVALTHQEASAEVLGRRRIRDADRAVEHPERDLSPAVRHVEQQPAVAARRIERLQHVEVRPRFDATVAIPWRQTDVGDVALHRIRGIEREPDDPGDLLVGADISERSPPEDDLARVNLERRHGDGVLSLMMSAHLAVTYGHNACAPRDAIPRPSASLQWLSAPNSARHDHRRRV